MSMDYFQKDLFNKNRKNSLFFQIPVYTRSMIVNIPHAQGVVNEKN
jgi:hypothetical protein